MSLLGLDTDSFLKEMIKIQASSTMAALPAGALGVIVQDNMPVGANGAAGPSNWQTEAIALKKKIKDHLSVGFDNFPDVLRLLLKQDCILSGSSISSIYHNEEVKDYDFWMKPDVFVNADNIRKNTVEKYSDAILCISEKYGDGMNSVPCVTPNAITFKNKFQLITLGDYYSERKNFDFLHCTPYYDLHTDKFYISERQYYAIRDKILIIHSEKRKIQDYRIQKFKQRGWKAIPTN